MNRQPISDQTNSLLIEEVSNCCPLCGKFEKTGKDFTRHHINHDTSKSEYWNLIRICQDCHNDLSKNKTAGTRERRVKLVKRSLFRKYFGPLSVCVLKNAGSNKYGLVTIMPVATRELCERGFLILNQANVYTVGPSTCGPTLSVYKITEEGKKILKELFNHVED